MQIEAVGSSALVERDIQAMESMALLQLSVNAAFGLRNAHALEPVLSLGSRLGLGHAMELQARHHVLARGAPGHERVGLEHVAGAAVGTLQRLAKHLHVTGAGHQQAGAAHFWLSLD